MSQRGVIYVPTFQKAPLVLEIAAAPSRLHNAAAQTPPGPSSHTVHYHLNIHSIAALSRLGV